MTMRPLTVALLWPERCQQSLMTSLSVTVALLWPEKQLSRR